MSNLVYRLSDGTCVTTLKEAKASGLAYIVAYVEIEEPHSRITEKQKVRRKAIR